MPIACQINFENNPQKIVFSGQKLHITVRMKLTEEMKIRRIYIQLRGMAHVSFVIDDCMCVSSYGQSGRYTTDETVLDMRKCLVDGNGNANKSFKISNKTRSQPDVFIDRAQKSIIAGGNARLQLDMYTTQ